MKGKSKRHISDFAVLEKIANECGQEGIAMFPTILSGDLTKNGGHIKFGVPSVAMNWFLKGSHYFVCYAVNKEDFRRIKSELEASGK